MTIRVRVEIPRDTALPEDVSVNTWHCSAEGATLPLVAAQAFVDDLETFYLAIDEFLGVTNNNPVVIKAYDLDDAEPRLPILVDAWTLVFGTTAIPEECAVALSMAAAMPSGVNRARRRGRVFIGPLGGNSHQIITGRVRVDSSFVTALVGAADGLLEDSELDTDYIWEVYSPTDGVGRPVVDGWVDNAMDTIRSRGPNATARTPFGPFVP
jgi:hypothetical protein